MRPRYLPFSFVRRFRQVCLRCLVGGLCLFSLPSEAWNTTGHREVIAVAWSNLSPAIQQRVSDLLARQRVIPNTRDLTGELAWMAAALWPDELRDQSDSSENLAPPANTRQWIERARSGQSTRRWHFADRNVALPFQQQPVHGLLEQTLDEQLRLLANPAQPAEVRAVALAWVSHLIADAHQPLHTASRADPLRPGQLDAGGNTVTVVDAGRRPPDPLSLHRWWDELPGHARPGSSRFDSEVNRLTHQAAQISGSDISTQPRLWIEESFVIARDQVYPGLIPNDEVPGTFIIRQDYWLEGRDITRARLALAARRLAQVVTQALRE